MRLVTFALSLALTVGCNVTGGGTIDGSPSVGSNSLRTVSVCTRFDRTHASLEQMLESGVQKRWIDDVDGYRPAGVVHNASVVCGDILVDGASDDIKSQVRVDGGRGRLDWAAYNNDAAVCVWAPVETTVNNDMVSVRPRPWDFTDGTSPDQDEGCDGWISSGL